ncbi:hypothetical protein [Sediminibacterium sp.]|uniref:hypothetical protein n=1 Tax=Sediminibacterium sp. TaxID=1917865 RepID=UPI0025E86CF4|nr:hypothetical protein [Sediminibacterium sp.]MBW0178312.1 hypothetical protein [Sediminibacterium sp.]
MRIYLFILICLISLNVYSQTDTVKLDNFRLPTTPAASVLNLGSTSITRPTTPQGVGTSLISGLGGSTFNPNISLEFSPYWLKSRPDIDFFTYYNISRNYTDIPAPDVWNNMMKTLALSVATSKLSDQRDTLSGTRLAIGLRTQLFSGKIPEQLRRSVRMLTQKIDVSDYVEKGIREILEEEAENNEATVLEKLQNKQINETAIIELVKKAIGEYVDLRRDTSGNQLLKSAAYTLIDDHWTDAQKNNITLVTALKRLRAAVLDKSIEALALQKIKSENKDKVGFIWELALAGVQYFPDNQFGRSLYQKTGIWSTMSYRSPDQQSEFSGLVRYSFSKNDSVSSHFDVGISANRIVDKGFNYGLEVIYRSFDYRYPTKDINGNNIQAIRSGSTYRIALNMEYKISEVLSLNASFGKDYNAPFVVKSNLLAVIGANISLPSLAGLGIER